MLPQKSEARGIISNMLHSYGAQDATWNSALENFRMIHRWLYLDSESFGVEIWMCEKNPWFDILWFDAADMICRYLRFESIINELIRSQSADHIRVVCWACFADDMFREFDSCLSLKKIWILNIFRWWISETRGLPNAMEASEHFWTLQSNDVFGKLWHRKVHIDIHKFNMELLWRFIEPHPKKNRYV